MLYWVSLKKYGVADYQYFKNGTMQQCNFSDIIKYSFYLVVYEVSTQITYVTSVVIA